MKPKTKPRMVKKNTTKLLKLKVVSVCCSVSLLWLVAVAVVAFAANASAVNALLVRFVANICAACFRCSGEFFFEA